MCSHSIFDLSVFSLISCHINFGAQFFIFCLFVEVFYDFRIHIIMLEEKMKLNTFQIKIVIKQESE